MTHDFVIRNAYHRETDSVVDIALDDGRIAAIGSVEEGGRDELDANSRFVSPGLVDCHLHVDKAFARAGDRVPRGNNNTFDFERIHDLERAYYRETDRETLTRNAVRDVEMAVAAGSTYLRSHVTVDTDVRELENMRAAVATREATTHLADLQLIPACAEDRIDAGRALLDEAIELGGDADLRNPVLLGGSDPASRYNDIEGALSNWFDIAAAHDVDIDLHIHDGGTLGVYTLERLAAHAADRGYEGRVTASHSYGLAHIPDWWLDEFLTTAEAVGLKFVTCYQSTRTKMPVRTMLERGVVLGHGTDNDRDFVFAHGNADSVEAMLVMMSKLHGDRTFEAEYRWLETNGGLAALWDLVTYEGARVLGIEDEYGIEVGNPADLVVFESASPQWAIVDQTPPRAVFKDGTIVAEAGEVDDDAEVLA
jgi:cytosine/adenosine deaminase-related metal-dependent hydrolase